MASILHKLFHPLFSGPPEPPRNKVTVVGVGQVGMACAVTILLRVRGRGFTFDQINPFPAGLAGGNKSPSDPRRPAIDLLVSELTFIPKRL